MPQRLFSASWHIGSGGSGDVQALTLAEEHLMLARQPDAMARSSASHVTIPNSHVLHELDRLFVTIGQKEPQQG